MQLWNVDNSGFFAISEIWRPVASHFTHGDLSRMVRTNQNSLILWPMPKIKVKPVYGICADSGWLIFSEWAPFELALGAFFPQRCQLQDAPNGVLIICATCRRTDAACGASYPHRCAEYFALKVGLNIFGTTEDGFHPRLLPFHFGYECYCVLSVCAFTHQLIRHTWRVLAPEDCN